MLSAYRFSCYCQNLGAWLSYYALLQFLRRNGIFAPLAWQVGLSVTVNSGVKNSGLAYTEAPVLLSA